MIEILIGVFIYFVIRCLISGFYTIDQNERAIVTSFGKAKRLNDMNTSMTELGKDLDENEKERYQYPILEVIGPGLHFKWPWESVYTASVATETMEMAYDPETPTANQNGKILEAVTRDQLNVGLKGQIRYRCSEKNMYAYFFGIKEPLIHVMGYYVSILRELIANYHKETKATPDTQNSNASSDLVSESISINDLRKNLREINDLMVTECRSSAARYGIELEASLITSIEPPHEVESALAAINTAYNNVSSEISLAKATADQTIVQSKRAVEIETLKAQAEVEPLLALASQLSQLKKSGNNVLDAFVRNVKMAMFTKAKKIVTNEGRLG